MALTRKALKAMGLTEEQVDSIIEAHTETVDGLKEQIKTYKADADKLEGVQKELGELKQEGGEDYKAKYEQEKQAHAQTKADYAAKETAAKVKDAYRALLKEAGVADKYIATAMRATDFSAMKLDKDGKLEGADTLTQSAKTEWADFIPATKTEGARVDTPPANTGGKMTKEQIIAIKDPAECRAAIAKNLDMFEGSK